MVAAGLVVLQSLKGSLLTWGRLVILHTVGMAGSRLCSTNVPSGISAVATVQYHSLERITSRPSVCFLSTTRSAPLTAHRGFCLFASHSNCLALAHNTCSPLISLAGARLIYHIPGCSCATHTA